VCIVAYGCSPPDTGVSKGERLASFTVHYYSALALFEDASSASDFPVTEVVQTTVKVSGSPDQVWREILAIDSIKASKPFLMYVGLPIPQPCRIQGHGVGAKRTCYFNSGYIEETVTTWNPPHYMGLSIDRTHLPGRHWLGFESADYRLEPWGDSTWLTRRTTVFSYLQPARCWRSWKRLGVESEHANILRDVVLKAKP